ncbi:MAG: hypothetical protein HYV42_03110 [Candidatus Magasanikbacteria bacterium]|nr:hypothetical protein [Candidatus Magasanikbacteria bacterium]
MENERTRALLEWVRAKLVEWGVPHDEVKATFELPLHLVLALIGAARAELGVEPFFGPSLHRGRSPVYRLGGLGRELLRVVVANQEAAPLPAPPS